MLDLKKILPPKIYNVLDRAGLCTTKQILILSEWDIKKLTNLCTADITLLKNIVSDHTKPQSATCDKLLLQDNQKVSTGCPAIDQLLRGGFRRGTLTEIYGESGSGKTQIAIQAAAHSRYNGTVYVCTEDLFPVKRFEQIKQSIPNYNPKNDSGKNVFVEHITEANDLLSCVRVRLPKLLEQHNTSLIILDSVAAPFRSEYTNYILRAEELRELAVNLMSLAQHHNLAVLCINQVTASFNGTDVIPSLGLAWSNMVVNRLWLRKTLNNKDVNIPNSNKIESFNVRQLSVVFSPELPNTETDLIITSHGIQCLNKKL